MIAIRSSAPGPQGHWRADDRTILVTGFRNKLEALAGEQSPLRLMSLRQVDSRHWFAEIKTLKPVVTGMPQQRQLLRISDPLRHDCHP